MMWLPPDWLVWTYAVIMGVVIVVSLLLNAVDKHASKVTDVDIISGIAIYFVIALWLRGTHALSPTMAGLLIVIIVMANLESTIRHLKTETWDSEEEKETVTRFTYGTVVLLILPAIYLLIVMATMAA